MGLWSTIKQTVARRIAVGAFGEGLSPLIDNFLRGQFPGAMGMPPYRGTREFLKAYSTMPWLRAVTSRIGSATASTQWHLYVARKQNGKAFRLKSLQYGDPKTRSLTIKSMVEQQELEPITDHPFLDAMHEGNAMIDGLNVRKLTQIYLDTVGESFWIKERNGVGAPVAFWPIPPHWIINTPTPTHRFYRYSFRGWQGEIPDTEILWIADPNPETPYYRGSGVGMSLADELETDEYAARMTRQFFFNNARPDFLVFPKNIQAGDQNIQSSEVVRLENDWTNKNQGMNRQWKPYFLNKEVGVHEFEKDFRALQLKELRQFERDTITQAFGFPPEILGVIESSNRATIDAADFLFARWVLSPRLEFLRSVFQHRLIPEYDDRLILDFESPVREDKDFQLAVRTIAPWAWDVDEWREFGGSDKKDDGAGAGVHMIPFNMQPTSDFSMAPPMPKLPDAGKGWQRFTADERAQILSVIEKASHRQLTGKS